MGLYLTKTIGIQYFIINKTTIPLHRWESTWLQQYCNFLHDPCFFIQNDHQNAHPPDMTCKKKTIPRAAAVRYCREQSANERAGIAINSISAAKTAFYDTDCKNAADEPRHPSDPFFCNLLFSFQNLRLSYRKMSFLYI